MMVTKLHRNFQKFNYSFRTSSSSDFRAAFRQFHQQYQINHWCSI